MCKRGDGSRVVYPCLFFNRTCALASWATYCPPTGLRAMHTSTRLVVSRGPSWTSCPSLGSWATYPLDCSTDCAGCQLGYGHTPASTYFLCCRRMLDWLEGCVRIELATGHTDIGSARGPHKHLIGSQAVYASNWLMGHIDAGLVCGPRRHPIGLRAT